MFAKSKVSHVLLAISTPPSTGLAKFIQSPFHPHPNSRESPRPRTCDTQGGRLARQLSQHRSHRYIDWSLNLPCPYDTNSFISVQLVFKRCFYGPIPDQCTRYSSISSGLHLNTTSGDKLSFGDNSLGVVHFFAHLSTRFVQDQAHFGKKKRRLAEGSHSLSEMRCSQRHTAGQLVKISTFFTHRVLEV